MLTVVILAISLRFFIFDFKHFAHIRDSVKGKHPLLDKLFGCPFCQSYHLFYLNYLILIEFTLLAFVYAFIGGYVGFLVYLGQEALIKYVYSESK